MTSWVFERMISCARLALAAAEQMKERRAEVMSAAPESITRSELNRRYFYTGV